MRNVLVVTMECPVPPVERAFSFEYGFPRTALLIASCIQEWGEEKGLIPKVLNMDEKLRAKRNELGSSINNETVFDDILAKTINSQNPELVCIVAPYTSVANWVIRAAIVSKTTNPDLLVITGGPHASFVSSHLLDHNDPIFDAVILGPGEAKLKHILDNFDNPRKRFRHPGIATPEISIGFSKYSQQNDVRIPPIDYSLISKEDIGDGGTVVMAGRGCPNACQFCLESIYWRKASVHYSKNASFVRNEMIDLTNLNVPVFGFGDSLIDMRTIANKVSKFEIFCHEALEGLKLHEHFSLLTRLHMIEKKSCNLFKEVGG